MDHLAKIVVLDDDRMTCKLVKFWLEKDGHTVRTAHRGCDAIDQNYLFAPDLLITDWNLESDYDGLEVADAFRFARPCIKLVLITGYSIDAIFRRSKIENFFRVIPKPLRRADISSVVEHALP